LARFLEQGAVRAFGSASSTLAVKAAAPPEYILLYRTHSILFDAVTRLRNNRAHMECQVMTKEFDHVH
jgi:hypothetical protein